MLKVQFLVDAAIWLIDKFYLVVGNYGVAIILTTFLVRALLLPLTLKQEKSMKRMKEIQPKLDALKEKYKNDKAMLNQKTAELYKTEGVNPLGGCLPLLIQLPIFVALYYAFLDSGIPKTAQFLWFRLGETDKLFTIAGFDFNLLPILAAILMVYQQKLMQPATSSSSDDPTASTMKTMMYAMPIMMLFFFYKLPSGLNLYYFVNTLLSIAQQMYVMNRR